MRLRGVGFVAVCAVVIGFMPAAGAGPSYAVSVFGPVPSPGHPFGVLATHSAVYTTTSFGQAWRVGAGVDAVFTYGLSGGKPIAANHVTTNPTMGLYGAAEDAAGRIYVVDMNGRILRFTPGSSRGLLGPETYATVPEPYRTLGWPASMWMLLAFDKKGNLYVTDANLGVIWRITPHGKPGIWFQSPDLVSFPPGTGPEGVAVGPDHKLYVAVTVRADHLFSPTIFRLPMTGTPPSADQLEVFHEFPFEPGGHPTPWPSPSDIVFGKSGKLYATLFSTDEVAVLDRAGREVHRIASKMFDIPLGMTFLGDSLLVASSNMLPPDNPTHSQILKIDVGEPGLPPIRPALP